MQSSEPITTETSKSEGRLKVDAGSHGKKKKILKSMISCCKDGKGGPGATGYGRPKIISTIKSSNRIKSSKSLSKKIGSIKSTISSVRSLNKKSTFGKVAKSLQSKGLKSMLKSFS